MININKLDDPFYRYKMPKAELRNYNNKTIIINIDEIAMHINTPCEILIKYISHILGTNYNNKDQSFNGLYNNDKIQEIIYLYINEFGICKNCDIPELTYIYTKISSKKNKLNSLCSACGSINENFNNEKITLLIIYYLLKNNNIWTKNKGLTV
jgi:translation initiation factor 2 beta subunit (eIF-2beta)/eIF-5